MILRKAPSPWRPQLPVGSGTNLGEVVGVLRSWNAGSGPASSNHGDLEEWGQPQRLVSTFRSLLHRIQTVSFPFNLPAFPGNLIL